MRTIKFRGKQYETGEWLVGDLIHFRNDVMILPLDANWFDFVPRKNNPLRLPSDRFVVDLSTVGQFTGLHDVDGTEIYEGDILLWTRKNVHIEGRPLQDFSHKCIVYYDNDKCAFQFRCELRCGACVGYLDFDDDRADESFVEVVGNVFDNPDLIEKGGDE